MRTYIKNSTLLSLNLLVFTAFLIFGSYYCSGQEKEFSFKDLVESADSLNHPIYLHKGSPFTGVVSDYYENGQLASKINLIDGKFNGLEVGYFENGNIKGKINYINNLIHGEFEEYFENGQLKEKANYINGNLNGPSVSYYFNGNLKKEGVISLTSMNVDVLFFEIIFKQLTLMYDEK